jgi:GNAT superfamily N-acetyltransferase
VFSEDIYDLDAKIEPWPHRYLMVLLGDDLVAVCGLYLRNTYVERYGLVSDDDIAALLREAGVDGSYEPSNRREFTKLVVARPFRNLRITSALMAFALARAFLDMDTERAPLVTFCVVRTMRRLIERHGIRTRHLKPFPLYKVHDKYRSESNPMDSYLVIPDLDVPALFRDLVIPGEYDLDVFLGGGA